MTFELLPAASRRATPWRNGGGWTREVAACGDPPEFRWRISIADVATDGPFSAFPGHDRVITMLSGAGMVLTVDGATTVIDHRHRPFAFAGGAETTCRLLDGPIVDFNVISAPGERASLEIRRGPITAFAVVTAVVVALEGPTDVAGRTLGRLDAVRIDDEPSVAINGGPVALVRFGNADR